MPSTCTRVARLLALSLAVFAFVILGNSSRTASADVSLIRINEVESNGGTPGDWVELINTSAAAVDVSGLKLRDSDPTHAFFAIPAGTSIPAGGYLVIEEAQFGFGLGGADSATVYLGDETTVVDSYAWSAHAATTYGRCPNGAGPLVVTTSSTKAAANDCTSPVRINEVESNGGTPGDWIELFNTGTAPADLSGFVVKDNDDTHVATIPAGTVLAAGAYYVVEEAALGFGLGSADSARLFTPDGTLVDSYSWAAHATTTYGRCPNGSGSFALTASSTKGGSNDCGGSAVSTAVKINEIESSGGAPGDWVELFNTGPSSVDLSGYVFKDNDETHVFSLPAGTNIAAGAFLVLDEAQFGFGLGSADAARLFAPGGASLLDSHSWTSHAVTTYGRCPNGTGAFITNTASTKGAANSCQSGVAAAPWPGDAAVGVADTGVLGGNMSGLVYEPSGTTAPGTLWAAKNGPSTLYRLVWDGTAWAPDAAASAGYALRYSDGTGDPDAEGVTYASSPAGGLYVATERNNQANATSRLSILRFLPSGNGPLSALNEWNITADLPAVGPNLGLEAITWVPDDFLVARGFFDEKLGQLYNPAAYGDHAGGLFFVGVEADGLIYGYVLDHQGGGFTRVATIVSGFPGVMDLQFDRELGTFWAVCDDGCQGRSAVLTIGAEGRFVVSQVFERPAQMPNINNEGFAVASQSECLANRKPAFWADDSNAGGFAIRQGTVPCNDDDGDGIINPVDPSPADATNDSFSDIPPGGATAGTILDRGGHTAVVADGSNQAEGLQLWLGGAGTADFQIQLSGKLSVIELANGAYTVTDPEQTTTVAVSGGGSARVVLSLGGLALVFEIGDGQSLTFTELTDPAGSLIGVRVDAVAGNITANGQPVAPGAQFIGPPTDRSQCEGSGWSQFSFPETFKNRGDCVRYLATAGGVGLER